VEELAFVDVKDSDCQSRFNVKARSRVSTFIHSVGQNGTFAAVHLLARLLMQVSPLFQWQFLCYFVGEGFSQYGLDVLVPFLTGSTDIWPHPMDSTFPKHAKCEMSFYGITGDVQVIIAHCQLPLNNMNQWIFFVYWWWLIFLISINTFMAFSLLVEMVPFYRTQLYRKAAINVIAEFMKSPSERITHQEVTRCEHSLRDICNCIAQVLVTNQIGYGDYLLLEMAKRIMPNCEFSAFLLWLTVTENCLIYIRNTSDENVKPKTSKIELNDAEGVPIELDVYKIIMNGVIEGDRNFSLLRPLCTA